MTRTPVEGSPEPAVLNDSAAVMTELLSDADSDVKEVLQLYDQSMTYEENLCNIESQEISSLEATAAFLGQEARSGASSIQRYRSARTLSDWIIMRIEGLFPQSCLECNESYTLRRTDTPPVRCNYCGGGLHNCAAILAEANTVSSAKSRVWMCNGCLSKHTLERFTSHLPVDPPTINDIPSLSSTRRGSDRDQILGNQSREPAVQTVQEIRVCKFYLQRRCRHGKSGTKLVNGVACRNSHPPLCKKYCNYGTMRVRGCQATDCNRHHPPLCKNSELRHECYKQSCLKQHLNDTRRTKPVRTEDPRPSHGSENVGNQGDRRNRNPSGRSRSRSENQGSGQVNWANNGNARTLNSAQPPQISEPDPAFLEILLDRLRSSIAGIVREELRNRPDPEPSQQFFSQPTQLPPGMGYTISPHPPGIIRTY